MCPTTVLDIITKMTCLIKQIKFTFKVRCTWSNPWSGGSHHTNFSNVFCLKWGSESQSVVYVHYTQALTLRPWSVTYVVSSVSFLAFLSSRSLEQEHFLFEYFRVIELRWVILMCHTWGGRVWGWVEFPGRPGGPVSPLWIW